MADFFTAEVNRHIEGAIIRNVDDALFDAGGTPLAIFIGLEDGGLPIGKRQLPIHVHIHNERIADIARPAQRERIGVGVVDPAPVGAQGGVEACPIVLEASPRLVDTAKDFVDRGAGVERRQCPCPQQDEGGQQKAAAQEVKGGGAFIAHGRLSPTHFLLGQMGSADIKHGQQQIDNQIGGEWFGAVIKINHAQEQNPTGQNHPPQARVAEGVPRGRIAECPENSGRMRRKHCRIAVCAPAHRLLHPIPLLPNQLPNALSPRHIGWQIFGAEQIPYRKQAIHQRINKGCAPREAGAGQGKPCPKSEGGNDEQNFHACC